MTKWQDKGVGFLSKRGATSTRPVINEDDGTPAGYHVEHWDDHTDAVARPKMIRVKATRVEEER